MPGYFTLVVGFRFPPVIDDVARGPQEDDPAQHLECQRHEQGVLEGVVVPLNWRYQVGLLGV